MARQHRVGLREEVRRSCLSAEPKIFLPISILLLHTSPSSCCLVLCLLLLLLFLLLLFVVVLLLPRLQPCLHTLSISTQIGRERQRESRKHSRKGEGAAAAAVLVRPGTPSMHLLTTFSSLRVKPRHPSNRCLRSALHRLLGRQDLKRLVVEGRSKSKSRSFVYSHRLPKADDKKADAYRPLCLCMHACMQTLQPS